MKGQDSKQQRSTDLLALVNLVQNSIRDVIEDDNGPTDLEALESSHTREDRITLPSRKLFQAQRTITAVAGKLEEMIAEPDTRLVELSSQYFESRALHICAEHRIADLLDEQGNDGVSVQDLGKRTGLEPLKLARVIRCLTSAQIFQEVKPEVFANNRISAALVQNEPLRAYIMLFALDLYSASDYLPSTLADPIKGHSYAVAETAFQSAVGTTLPRWEWLEERVPVDQSRSYRMGYPGSQLAMADKTKGMVNGHASVEEKNETNESTLFEANDKVNGLIPVEKNSKAEGHPLFEANDKVDGLAPVEKSNKSDENSLVEAKDKVNGLIPVETNGKVNGHASIETITESQSQIHSSTKPRPELEIFGLAMLGGGRVMCTAHLYDYPWQELGKGTVVDVGGGVGGLSLQLSRLYSDLRFIVQDRPEVIEQGQRIWEKESPDAVRQKRVELMPHDFFTEQPVKSAEVYWLRYVLHDWSDEYCVKILSSVVSAMSRDSRVLIADQVMNTTIGCPEIQPAPEPLPANYGHHVRFSHHRDLCLMSCINGIERTPDQFRSILKRSGLTIRKIWQCRSQVSIVECRLLDI